MQGGNNFIKNMEKQAVRKKLGGLFYKLGMAEEQFDAGIQNTGIRTVRQLLPGDGKSCPGSWQKVEGR